MIVHKLQVFSTAVFRDDVHPTKTAPEKPERFKVTAYLLHPARIDGQNIVIELDGAKTEFPDLLEFLDQSWHGRVPNGARPQIGRITKVASLRATARRKHSCCTVRVFFLVCQKIMVVVRVAAIRNRDCPEVVDEGLFDNTSLIFSQRSPVPIV